MPYLKFLITLFLILLGAILLLLGLIVGGWQSAPFIVVVWAIARLIEKLNHGHTSDSWKIYLVSPVMFISLLFIGFIAQEDAPTITKFNNLKVSTGVLKKWGRDDISLVKKDGTSISLICKNNYNKKFMIQTCLRDFPEQAYGKEVIVYHEHEFKFVKNTALFYEIRQNGVALVKYNDVVESIERNSLSREQSGMDFLIILFVSSICSIIDVWLRWRAQQSS